MYKKEAYRYGTPTKLTPNKLTMQPIKIHLFGKLKLNKHCIISNALIEKEMCHIEPFVFHQLYYLDLAYG